MGVKNFNLKEFFPLFFKVSLSIATFLATLLLLTMPFTSFGGKWIYFIWVNEVILCDSRQ